MVRCIRELTEDQQGQMQAYAQRWIEKGSAAGATDRAGFEAAARRYYRQAGLPWRDTVVWVSSPPVLAAAAPLATQLRGMRAATFLGRVQELFTTHTEPLDPCELRPAPAFMAEHDQEAHAVVTDLFETLMAAVDARVVRTLYDAIVIPVRESLRAVHGPVMHEAHAAALHGAAVDTVQPAVRLAAGGSLFRRYMCQALEHGLQSDRQVIELASGSAALAGIAAGASFLREICGLTMDDRLWRLICAFDEMLACAYSWCSNRDFHMVCERPRELHITRTGAAPGRRDSVVLHRADGPAASWPDGWAMYALHGVRVAPWIIKHPEKLTVRDIICEINAEVRRAMLERYGWARYIADCGAEVVDSIPPDHELVGLRGARLLRTELSDEPEPIVYLEMVNSAPEADGSHRRYLERIDPKVYGGAAGRLCVAAMASRWYHRDADGLLVRTFSDFRDYKPCAES
jgi:hypothetical protein